MPPVPVLADVRHAVAARLREGGALAAVVVDMLPLGRIERRFGNPVHRAAREQVEPVLAELQRHVREGDLMAWDDRASDRLFVFLVGHRENEAAYTLDDVRKLTERVEAFLAPRIARIAFTYLRERPGIEVGYGFVLWNPLESEERQLWRLSEDALATASLRRVVRERNERERLLEVIHGAQVWTAFQPIVEIETGEPLGHEALSRGPRGTDLESPGPLFALAARHGLVEDLERACRRVAFRDWEFFGAPTRLFLNTVPGTIRDASFLGRGLLGYLGPTLSPQMVTLEITEREIIENLNLYREAMHAFLDLGFTFAIDDVGAGHSGLETVATLQASYLKIDMSLVRDIHEKRVNQQVVKAILEMGQGMGATVIAEGIQTVEEKRALQDLGMRYGQGYLWGRPKDPRAAQPVHVVAKP
ncbi:MAG: EAL domain-containing protein [Vicinamibacteria bacterium]|jgi:EAL domain-containing protein (putative c-di-GMP-specific phosphodiesterase class I)|nr:EAL domain-containing protein [Vicinamibacteria bacterium]